MRSGHRSAVASPSRSARIEARLSKEGPVSQLTGLPDDGAGENTLRCCRCLLGRPYGDARSDPGPRLLLIRGWVHLSHTPAGRNKDGVDISVGKIVPRHAWGQTPVSLHPLQSFGPEPH